MFADQYLGIYNIMSYQDKRLSFNFSLIAKSYRCAKCSASNRVQNEVGSILKIKNLIASCGLWGRGDYRSVGGLPNVCAHMWHKQYHFET